MESLTLKKVREVLKDYGYKAVVNNNMGWIYADIKFKDNIKKFEMIRGFKPYLVDFEVYKDSVTLCLNREVLI